jgi:di/tricarboxylate transporter
MTPLMLLALTVIAIPLALVMLDRWRIDLAALFIIVVLRLAQYLGLGILSTPHTPSATALAISGFSQPVVITLIGLFVLTQSLTNNGVMLWLGQTLNRIGRGSETRLIFLFTLSAALLSLLMNNVAVGALLLPSAMNVARQSGIRPSKLLIPIAYGTALGGMATYFTTANIVISNLLTISQPPQAPLGVLSFAATGGLIAVAGILYIVLIGRRTLPAHDPGPEQLLARRGSTELENLYSIGDRLWEAKINPSSPLAGKTLKSSRIGEKLGIAVIAIWRGRQAIFTPAANEALHPDDVLVIVGREERVAQLAGMEVSIGREQNTITRFGVTLVELILAPHSAYEAKTIKTMNFRRKYGFTAVALLRQGHSYRTDVGDMPLELGDSLLMIGPPDRVRDLRVNPDVIILEPDPASRAIPRRRAVTSVLIFIAAIVAALLGVPVYLAVLAAAVLTMLLGLLPIQEAYRAIEWQVIFFIAGMYVASLAMVNTGLAALIGKNAIAPIEQLGPLGLAGAVFLLSAGLTQLMGSQATAFVVGPLAISAAIHIGANAQAIAVASAIGCSASFLTPTAHAVNVIMMNPGNYRFRDFARAGWGLMLVTFLALMAGMVLFWNL